MLSQFNNEVSIPPEFEYQVEEMKKKLHCSMANFAHIRFKRAVEMRMSVVKDAR